MQGRINFVDTWRGLAILGMVIFHFFYDLDMFGYIHAAMFSGGWLVFARIIQVSFLLLVGISTHIIWTRSDNCLFAQRQLKRFVKVASCAGLVSLGSWLIFSEQFIFFGILHLIAASILVLTITAKLNRWIIVLLAIGIFVLARVYAGGEYSSNSLIWLGLYDSLNTLDYFPVLPWLSVPMLGFGFGKEFVGLSRDIDSLFKCDWLSWLGKRSLFVYLVHQPILFGVLHLFSLN